MALHDEVLRKRIEARGRRVFSTMGDGTAAAFASAPGAVSAALSAQR